MSQVTFSPPHPILFIYDPTNANAEIPEYSPNNLAFATKDGVYVGTRADVDGDVTVTLIRDIKTGEPLPKHKVFEGFIETPNRKVAVITSDLNAVLKVDVNDTVAKICIWADDLRNPGTLLITAE